MKKIILFIAVAFISIACFSQDLISLKNGTRMEAIVTEITPTLVRYKLHSDPNGRVYFMYKDDVSGIMYKDGRVDTFNQSGRQMMESNPNWQSNSSYSSRENPGISRPVSNPTGLSARHSTSQFHAGIVFPQGNFGDGNEKTSVFIDGKSGCAAVGFNLGYKHYTPIQSDYFSFVFGIDIFYNGITRDLKDYIEDDGDADLTFPSYINVPAIAGLNTGLSLNENLKLYAEAGLGINYSKITNMTSEFDDTGFVSISSKATFDSSFNFAYALEGGIVIQDKYTIGLRYNDLGSNKYKYKTVQEYNYYGYNSGRDYKTVEDKGKFNRPLSITNLTLAFGVLF